MSGLNAHLYPIQKDESPICSWGDIQKAAHHYLLYCGIYAQPRLEQFKAISALLQTDFFRVPPDTRADFLLHDKILGVTDRQTRTQVFKDLFSKHVALAPRRVTGCDRRGPACVSRATRRRGDSFWAAVGVLNCCSFCERCLIICRCICINRMSVVYYVYVFENMFWLIVPCSQWTQYVWLKFWKSLWDQYVLLAIFPSLYVLRCVCL